MAMGASGLYAVQDFAQYKTEGPLGAFAQLVVIFQRAVSSSPARSFDRSLKHSTMMSMTPIRIAKWWRFF
jgi:hypothetical protein